MIFDYDENWSTTALAYVVSTTSTYTRASMCDSSVTVRSTTVNFKFSMIHFLIYARNDILQIDVSATLNVYTD